MSTSPFNKYIVMINGIPAQLNEYTNTPKGGILLSATPGTLFGSRREASAAIKRSLKFANENNLPWEEKEYRIERVQEGAVVISGWKY